MCNCFLGNAENFIFDLKCKPSDTPDCDWHVCASCHGYADAADGNGAGQTVTHVFSEDELWDHTGFFLPKITNKLDSTRINKNCYSNYNKTKLNKSLYIS